MSYFSCINRKKRSVPVCERPQKAANSYARMFAAQKEKKAKETRENEGKNSHNNDVNHKSGAIEQVNPPQAYMDGISYGGHSNTGWTVDNGIPSTYDPVQGTCVERDGCLTVFCPAQ